MLAGSRLWLTGFHFWWSPVGDRHDVGIRNSAGWHAKKRSRDEGWGCSIRSPLKESKDVPRTHWPGRQGSSCGQNRRSVVQRDSIVLVFNLRSRMPNPGKHDARKCPGRLALQVASILSCTAARVYCALLQGQMAMSPTCRMWSETTVSVEGSMWWARFGHDSAIFPCSRSRFQPLSRAQKIFDVDRFLEPFKGVCASVRTRTDTALDQDLVLKATVFMCALSV